MSKVTIILEDCDDDKNIDITAEFDPPIDTSKSEILTTAQKVALLMLEKLKEL